VNPNGTEAKSTACGYLLMPQNLPSEHTISIKFTKPLTTLELGTAPFNPFIIANKSEKRNSFTLFKTYNFR
jgi:hypothetical protein